jgi:hypothetical protein
MRAASRASSRRGLLTLTACIFFLTFISKNLIKGTQPRSEIEGAKSDVKGELLDEERNQEKGACKEEGCSEEKEVVTAGSKRASFNHRGPEQSGPFSFLE